MTVEKATPRTNLTSIAGWKLGRTLGRGAYAHVRLATHPNGHQAACKILPALHRPRKGPIPWDETMDAIEAHKEVVLLKALAGAGLKGIVGLEGVIEEGGWTYVFLTLYEHSASSISMKDPKGQGLVLSFFRRLCHVMHSLHQLGISHEDIKRSNILLDKHYHPIVVDFGFSHFSPEGEHVKSAGGTLDYSSPEKVKDRWYDPKASDVWALGILLIKLLELPHPFSRSGDASTKVKNNIVIQEPYLESISRNSTGKSLRNLLEGMLCKVPEKRLTIPQILRHPFLATSGSLPLYRPTPCKLPEDFPLPVPESILEDVCFLAHLNKKFYFCETPKRIRDSILGPNDCWEKRLAGFLSKWSQKEELQWEDIPKQVSRDTRAGQRRAPVPRPLQAIHLSPNIQKTHTGASDKTFDPKAAALPLTGLNDLHQRIGQVSQDKENVPRTARKAIIGSMRTKDANSRASSKSHITVQQSRKPVVVAKKIKTPARIDFARKRVMTTQAAFADLRGLEELVQTPSPPRYTTSGKGSDASETSLEGTKTVLESMDQNVKTTKNKGKLPSNPPGAPRRSRRLMDKHPMD